MLWATSFAFPFHQSLILKKSLQIFWSHQDMEAHKVPKSFA